MSSPLTSLQARFKERQEQSLFDVERFKALDHNECLLCGAYGDDKRTLHIYCFYDVKEVVPEAIDCTHIADPRFGGRGFYLLICKSCRARFLSHLAQWRLDCLQMRHVEKDHDGRPLDDPADPERNIPVRVNGVVEMLTRQEWDERIHQKPEEKEEGEEGDNQ